MFQHDKGKQHAKQRAKSKKEKQTKATKELSMRKQTTQTNPAFQDCVIGFNPAKFAAGFLGGVAGSKASKQTL